MADYTVTVGSAALPITITCEDSTGTPVDLTGATAEVEMYPVFDPSTLKVDTVATVDADQTVPPGHRGQVHYTLAGADLDTVGLYCARARVANGSQVNYYPDFPLWIEVLA